jgi:hypothetical protein
MLRTIKKEYLLIFVLLAANIGLSGCLESSSAKENFLFLKQDMNLSDLNVFSDLDGGFSNSVYLVTQVVDGGGA